MKAKILLVVLASAVASHAATINVGRGFGNTGLIADGLTAGGYAIAVGTFSSVPSFTDFDSLVAGLSTWSEFTATTAPTSGPTVGTITGAFTATGGGTPEAFNNNQIYFYVGNAATLGESTALGVFRVDTNFPPDVSAGGATVVTVGNAGSIITVPGGGTADGSSFALVAVPEPSVAILGALGFLGLVRRRR